MLVQKDTLRCDFHCHSFYSDGARAPADVAAAMKANGVQVFALTDHDTVRGVAEAQTAAAELGIRCLGGIELTIQWENGTFHLLGLGLQDLSVLGQALDEIQERRRERNEMILKKLRKQGLNIDGKNLRSHCGKNEQDVLNRSHIAAYLFDLGYSPSVQEAFQRYLSVGAPAYVPIDGPLPEEGIEWIHNAGGHALIAHPHSLHLSWRRLGGYVAHWRRAGLDGLEVSHPRTSLKDSKRLSRLVENFDMQYCGGSDYHCGETENVLGLGTGGRPIELPVNLAFLQGIAKC